MKVEANIPEREKRVMNIFREFRVNSASEASMLVEIAYSLNVLLTLLTYIFNLILRIRQYAHHPQNDNRGCSEEDCVD